MTATFSTTDSFLLRTKILILHVNLAVITITEKHMMSVKSGMMIIGSHVINIILI